MFCCALFAFDVLFVILLVLGLFGWFGGGLWGLIVYKCFVVVWLYVRLCCLWYLLLLVLCLLGVFFPDILFYDLGVGIWGWYKTSFRWFWCILELMWLDSLLCAGVCDVILMVCSVFYCCFIYFTVLLLLGLIALRWLFGLVIGLGCVLCMFLYACGLLVCWLGDLFVNLIMFVI